MSQTGEIREYCNNHKGGLFDLGYLSKTIFKDIPLANLRKYVTRLVEDGMLHQISKGIFIIGDTELSNEEIILKHYLIDHRVIIKGIPAKEYLLSTLELTSKENVDITIYSNQTYSNKNICGVKVMASKDVYALISQDLAILLELIHCESIIEEDYEVAWAYKIYELAKSYKDSSFSKHHMFYPRKVYIRLANLLESMHISNRVMEIYESKKEL